MICWRPCACLSIWIEVRAELGLLVEDDQSVGKPVEHRAQGCC